MSAFDTCDLPEGFILHEGGPCPVAHYTKVAVIFRDESDDDDAVAWFWMQDVNWWEWEGDPSDNIVGYKVL